MSVSESQTEVNIGDRVMVVAFQCQDEIEKLIYPVDQIVGATGVVVSIDQTVGGELPRCAVDVLFDTPLRFPSGSEMPIFHFNPTELEVIS